jgi:hypothetical protein|tara:strand:- start:399 stop:605 length:207 start_codon:yes stop_codon:yes gene_type:complete
MDNVIDLIATDASASEISDKIKELMYAKAGERVEAIRPTVAQSMFDEPDQVDEPEEEIETEPEEESEE